MTGSLVLSAIGGAAAAVVLTVTVCEWRRRSSLRHEGFFPCRLSAVWDSHGTRSYVWPRRSVKAHWVHDVFVVYRGGVDHGTYLLPVSAVHGGLEPVIDLRGDEYVSLRLELDDGSKVDVAARPQLADELIGPFLGAHASLGEAQGWGSATTEGA